MADNILQAINKYVANNPQINLDSEAARKALANYISSQCGEIGKHNRLKICRPFGLVGSSPTTGTILSPYSLMAKRPSYTRLSSRCEHVVGSSPTRGTNYK